ncbi:hypothetical protein ABNQ39_22410 [Azospirillum sp. A26]|uniref:NACHT domain-containing protein n=1 Tax=Azospirillum sp. A26 TaxID=3160607 RepID=UPI00366DA36B
MTAVYIPRALVVGERTFTEEQLLQEGRVFVVLAEPGAGKTELLKTLANLLQTTRIKASIFRNKLNISDAGHLVLDAMDEVARIDSGVTDQIIARASELSASTVIFSGRSGEWDRGRTAYVEQCFGVKPIIVRLEPFNENEQRQLFNAEFPKEDFQDFAEKVQKFELTPLLGNPQFLQLLGAAYLQSDRVFTSKAKIFADAVKRLAHEANPELGRQKARPPTDEIIVLGGEVFAKLMLAGATGIATVEQLSDRDFPYINSLCRNVPQSTFLVDTRLLKPSDDADKHEPIHRIVAEYCAAGYLVRRIEDPADRLSLERVFAIIAPNGVTRDELRGMLGWMAALGREPLQLAAIKLDPYAVLANGDPSQLTAAAKRMLLAALDKLAVSDPLFRRSDVWRRFNVGHFFSTNILDTVCIILGKAGALRSLILELLIGTEAVSSLIPELTALMKNPAVDGDTRKLAQQALLSAPAYDYASDFADLIAEGSADALEVAARIVTRRGVSAVSVSQISALLAKLSDLYPKNGMRHRDGISRYFINLLVRSFDLPNVIAYLDDLSAGLTCICSPKYEYQCTCRYEKSKIIGKLLDRYFEISAGINDPVRIWSWLKDLRFKYGINGDRSAAVKHLSYDHDLRRSIQQLALQGVNNQKAAQDAITYFYLSNGHSGLNMREGDRHALSQYAFDHGLVDVWAELLFDHNIHSNTREPNPTRALQRRQSRTSLDFLAPWSRREKLRREFIKKKRNFGYSRSRKRYAQREAAIEKVNRAHLRENLAEIEAGRHWGWLRQFAQNYLLKSEEISNLVDDPETPLKALRNCFPMLNSHIPTVERLGSRNEQIIAQVLLAACIVRFRDGESLDAIDPHILAAAKTEVSEYHTFADGEDIAFEAALDSALFKESNSAESFVRAYMEQQLTATEEVPVHVYWLNHKSSFQHLRATLPVEWLERFPQMPLEAARTLFSMAAKYGSRKELLALIDRRLTDPIVGSGNNTEADERAGARRKFWQINAFLYHASGSDVAWKGLKDNPKAIFDLEHRLGRNYLGEGDSRPPMTAEKVFQIMDAYIEKWPKVPLPSSWGSADPEDERAYRFLRDHIWTIAEDTPERRIPVLDRMIDDPRFWDFREIALTLRAEANRKIALQDFRAPHPSEVVKLLDENEVASVEDLRAVMVEELGEVQKWLEGSETDPLDAFYSGGERVDENTARNRIVDRLHGRMIALGLSVVIERHMSGGNRCDITASATIEGTNRLLVIEVKGQWNKELYTAASAQLNQRYAIHPDAAKQGVYLALWFGNGEKVAGLSNSTIATAAELKDKIISTMSEDLQSRIDVVVLDLSRRSPVPNSPKLKRDGKAKT